LLLCPADPQRSLGTPGLRDALARIGLIGAPLAGIGGGFLAGEGFLGLIIFAGCSVTVELSPAAAGDGPFTHVRLLGPFRDPRLISGRNTRPPRCPGCRAPHRGWRTALAEAGVVGAPPLACPACGAVQPPWAWDWKGTAGCGRVFVDIEEIFPGEATPAPALNAALEQLTGSPWRHFYVQDS
jgi:hypothetical protein